MTKVVVFDPGMTSGVVFAEIRDNLFPIIEGSYEVPGGLEGMCEFLDNAWDNEPWGEHWVAEKFRMTPRVRTADQVEPLRIEGALQLRCPWVVWQYPDSMLLAGGDHGSASRNKTAADNVLRALGLWTLPSQVDNHTDANDINSAMKHLIAYLRNIGHEPTLAALEQIIV